jgi:hypothetical protein
MRGHRENGRYPRRSTIKNIPHQQKNEDEKENAEPVHAEPQITYDRKHCSYAGAEQQVVYGFTHLIHHVVINADAS